MAGPWDQYAEADAGAPPWEQYQDTGERALPKGVKPSAVEGGRGSATDPRRTDAPQTPKPTTEGVFDPMTGLQIGERDISTDDGRPIDEKRTRSAGRVTDKTIPGMTPGSLARDAASGALQIGPTAVKGVGDLARLATGDRFGKSITDFAERGNRAIQDVVGSERGAMQRKQFEQDMQDPALNAADVIVGNPGALADMALPTIGSMALPVAAAGAATKLATGTRAAQLASAIDPAIVAARANTAREAAVLGTTIAQNAGSGYSESRDAGLPQDQSYMRAAITAPFTYVAGRLTGGGAEGQVARTLIGKQGVTGAVKAGAQSAIKEAGQEGGETVGDYVGETVGKGEEFDLNKATKQVAVGATLGAVIGGGAGAASAASVAREATIKQLRDAGETGPADLLQAKHDKLTAAESVDSELQAMPGNEQFQGHYRNMRTAGVKPAEAAARAATTTVFGQVGERAGMTPKAIDAALQKASTLPVDQVPAFLDKYTKALAARGLAQPFDGIDALGSSLEAARDEAIDAAVGAAYTQGEARKAMDDVLALEQKNQPKEQSNPAPDAIETVAPIIQPEDSNVSRTDDVPGPDSRSDQRGGADPGIGLPAEPGVPDGRTVQQPGNADSGPAVGPVSLAAPDAGELNAGVLDDTNPQAGAEPQAEAPASQAAEGRAATETGAPAAGEQAGDADIQAPWLTYKNVDSVDTSPEPAQKPPKSIQVGRNNIPLTEGGKPFKTKLAADLARKGQTTMRTVRVEGGFALAEKTEAQLRASEAAAKRLRTPNTSPASEAIPAHAMIASEGGLSPFERADMGMEGNVKVGNRSLFAGTGKGMSIERATEKLIEDGYLQEGASHDQARSLIKRSLTSPQYTPEGTERMAEKEAQERFEAELRDQEAIAKVEGNTDNQFKVVESLQDDVPDFDAPSSMSEADAMRAMGFTDQEIESATANRSDQPQGNRRDDGGADAPAQGEARAGDGQRTREASRDSGPGSDRQGPDNEVKQTPPTSGVSNSEAFVTAPGGGRDFGEITPDMAAAMRRQAGKIRLQEGNDTFGLRHIESRHGDQIRKAGYPSIPRFVADALSQIDTIWKPAATTQLVVLQTTGKGRAVFIQLTPGKDSSGDFYTVNTAFPTGKGFGETKEGWKTLWSRIPGPAEDSGKPSSFAEPASKTGRQDTMDSNQSEAVSLPEITYALRDSGSLAVKGNPQAIRDKLVGITKITPMEGGMMVGKTQAQRAIDILDGKPAEAKAARPLSVGIMASNAEPVTVKDATVYIGKNEAINFDSGEPVTVKAGASDADIVRALKDAGALSRRQKVFGVQESAESEFTAQEKSTKTAEDAIKSAPAPDAKPERPEALIELRKRESVLKALSNCLG